jgi:hypothetical protein
MRATPSSSPSCSGSSAKGWNPTATASPRPWPGSPAAPAYGPDSLRGDFARFRFLLGLTDGEGLVAPDEP